MFRTLFRILFGFVLACFAAGLVTVLFVITPLELVGLEDDALAQRLAYRFVAFETDDFVERHWADR